MSIGPTEVEMKDPKSVEAIRKVKVFTSALVGNLFARPSYFLFYLGVIGLLVGLYLGKTFSFEYHVVVLALGFIELCLWVDNRREKK